MNIKDEDGYELWLRYRKVNNSGRLAQYHKAISSAAVLGKSATAEIIRSELARALPALLGKPVPLSAQKPSGNALVVGTGDELEVLVVSSCTLEPSPTVRSNALGGVTASLRCGR